MKTPVAGGVVTVNEVIVAKLGAINQDPCIQGCLVKVKPSNGDADIANLKTGAAVSAPL